MAVDGRLARAAALCAGSKLHEGSLTKLSAEPQQKTPGHIEPTADLLRVIHLKPKGLLEVRKSTFQGAKGTGAM